MIRKDCFAYCKKRYMDSEYEDCNALRYLVCKNKECKFFKTKMQYDNDLKKAEEKLMMVI